MARPFSPGKTLSARARSIGTASAWAPGEATGLEELGVILRVTECEHIVR
jgi:hypothetical protein